MKYLVYLFLFFVSIAALAQNGPDSLTNQNNPAANQSSTAGQSPVSADSLAKADSIAQKDSSNKAMAAAFSADTARLGYMRVLKMQTWYNFFAPPQKFLAEEHKRSDEEAFFYIMAGLLFFFALVKIVFARYVNNLLALVFRGSLRQKQIREQLLQTPLASLLLNIFFVLVGGLYVYFLLQHYEAAPALNFWLLLLYCILVVGLVYLGKFVVLKFIGWIFNMRDAADTYIFIVFLVNKLLAIFLLPLLIIMVYSMTAWVNVLLTLSYILVVVFFAYRYIVSFSPVTREVKVSQFHFFVYLCAFEIIPLLLIYKILLRFF